MWPIIWTYTTRFNYTQTHRQTHVKKIYTSTSDDDLIFLLLIQ